MTILRVLRPESEKSKLQSLTLLQNFQVRNAKKANVYIHVEYEPWESYYVDMSAKKL